MDGRVLAVNATAKSVLAKVVREFAGSRVEKQIVAQVVEIAWRVAARAGGGAQSFSTATEGIRVGGNTSTSEGVRP